MGCGPSQDSSVVQQSAEQSPQAQRKNFDSNKIRRLIGGQVRKVYEEAIGIGVANNKNFGIKASLKATQFTV